VKTLHPHLSFQHTTGASRGHSALLEGDAQSAPKLQVHRVVLSDFKRLSLSVFLLAVFLAFGQPAFSQETIVGWDFANGSYPGGSGNYGPSPAAANTIAPNITSTGLTRSGFTTINSGAANAWGGTGGNGSASFTVKANTGFTLSLAQISAYNVRRSSSGATTGQWAYSLDGTNFVDIGTAITWGSTTTNAGNAQTAIPLSGISTLQNLPASTTVTFRVTASGASGTGTWYLNNFQTGDDFVVTGTVTPFSSPPNISTAGTLTAFTTTTNATSPSQSLTVNGTNLTASILATTPAGFEVSTDDSLFGPTATITQTGGNASSSLFVRLASAPNASTPAGNLTLTSTGATPVVIALSGTVIDPNAPALAVSPTTLPAFSTNITFASAVQTLAYNGTNLTQPITINATGGFEVSTDNSTFSTATSVTLVGANSTGSVFVRIAASPTPASLSGNLTLTSTGLSRTVALTGVIIDPTAPEILFTGNLTAFSTQTNNASTSQNITVTGTKLSTPILVNATGGFEVRLGDPVGNFTTSLSIPQNGGNATGTVYARLAARPTAGNATGNLTLESAGALPVSISLNGTVTAPPVLSNTGNFTAFLAKSGENSTVQSIGVLGTNLTANVSISVGSPFQISTNNSSFGANATIVQSSGTANGTLYVRVPGNATVGSISANVTISSPGASPIVIPINGTVSLPGLSLVLPPVIRAGVETPGRVFLAANATSDVVVNLSSTPRQLTVPTTVTIPAGKDHVVFPINALSLGANVTARIDAISGNENDTETLTISPTALPAVSLREEGYVEDFSTFLGQRSFPYGWSYNGNSNLGEVTVWGSISASGPKNSSDQVKVFGVQPGSTFNSTTSQTVLVRNDTRSALSSLRVTFTGRTLRGPNDAAPADRDVFYSVSVNGTTISPEQLYYSSEQGDGVVVTAVLSGLNIPAWSTFPITWTATVGQGFDAAKQIGIGDVRLEIPKPELLLLPESGYSNFSTTNGTASEARLFYVSGQYLNGPVSVGAPAGYEVSLSPGTGYTGTVLKPAGNSADLAAFPVYVRLAGNGNGTASGFLSVSSNGAPTLQAPLGGVVFAGGPTQTEIHPSRTAMNVFETIRPEPSATQSFHVSGRNLKGSVTIFAPPQFQVSQGNTENWTAGLVIPRDAQNNLAPTEVRVRLLGDIVGTFNGTIRLTSNLVEYSVVTVNGTVMRPAPEITLDADFDPFSSTRGAASPEQTFTVSATDLIAPLALRVPEGFEMLDGTVWRESVDLVPDGNSAVTQRTFSIRIGNFAAAFPISGALVASSTGALSKQSNLVGTVTANDDAWISARPASLSGFRAPTNSHSEPRLFEVGGKNLESDLTVLAPPGYEISSNGTSWGPSLQLARQNVAGGNASSQTIASDIASNYGTPAANTWGNGSNAGNGFQPWLFNVGNNPPAFFAGAIIGDPSLSAGIANLPSPAFGLYANPSGTNATVTVTRSFNKPLEIGQSLSFLWGINWDSGSTGRKGFVLSHVGGEAIVVNNGNSEAITIESKAGSSTVNTGFAYGTNAMQWTFTQTSNTTVSVTATPRGNGTTFTTNLTTSGPLASLNFYASGMQAGDNAQPYFNNLQITAPGNGTVQKGDVPTTPLFVRLTANQSEGPRNGTMTVSGTGVSFRTISLQGDIVPPPTLTVSPSRLGNFLTVNGIESRAQSFELSGSSLVGNVTLTAGAGLEISAGGGNFTTGLSVLSMNGSLSSVPIQVRISAGANSGNLTGNITINASGEFDRTTNAIITVEGLVVASDGTPQILTPNPASLGGFRTTAGMASAEQSLIVSAVNLTTNLTATAAHPFEVAADNGDFGATASLAPDQRYVPYRTFRVRISANATAANPLSRNLTLSSTNATSRVVNLSGIVDSAPALSVSPASLVFNSTQTYPSASQSFQLTGANLLVNGTTPVPVTITASGPFEVSLTGAANSWASSVPYTPPASGNFTRVPIQVRLKGDASVGNSSGTVTLSATGLLVPPVVNLQGTVLPRPLIRINGSAADATISGLFAYVGENSTEDSFQVEGVNLQGNVELDAPQGFEISTDGSAWSDSINLVPSFSGGNSTVIGTVEIASDNAGNYGGNWTNGSNGGTGFGPWSIQNNGNAQTRIDDPFTTAGITGMNTASFQYGGTDAYTDAARSFSKPMVDGDVFRFQWGNNWDTDGIGNKGINIYTGGISGKELININMGGNAVIAIKDETGVTETMFNEYGVAAILLNFEYSAPGSLRVFATGRDGKESFNKTYSVSGAPDAFKLYAGQIRADSTNRFPYANEFQITSLNRVPSGGILSSTQIHVRMKVPATAGNFSGNITVDSTNAVRRLVSVNGSAQVMPPPTIADQTINGTVGVPLSFSITATPLATSYGYNGTIPSGLSFNATTGTFSGTPAQAGNHTLQVSAQNKSGTGTGNYTFVIAKGTPQIATWPSPAKSYYFGQTLANVLLVGGVAGGNPPLAGNFTFTNSSTQPPVGTSNQSVTFTPLDSANWNTISRNVTVQVNPAATVAPSISPGTIVLTVGDPVPGLFTVNATFGPTAYSGNLPDGLAIDPLTGQITGSPFIQGNYTVPVQATNPIGTGSGNITFVINKGTPFEVQTITARLYADETLGTAYWPLPGGGSMNVPGTFQFNENLSMNATEAAGRNLNVTFTPYDTTNWNPVNIPNARISVDTLPDHGPLSLSANLLEIVEGDIYSEARIRVTRSGPLTFAATVNITEQVTGQMSGDVTGDPGMVHFVDFPAQVTIPAGSRYADFHVIAKNDSVYSGNRTATLLLGSRFHGSSKYPISLTIVEDDIDFASWSNNGTGTPELVRDYAVGGAPMGQRGELPSLTFSSTHVSLDAMVRTHDPKLSILGEWTSDLKNGPWTPVNLSVHPTQTGPGAGFERRFFSIPIQPGETQKFLRLRIQLQE
jgi:hypothetical protein